MSVGKKVIAVCGRPSREPLIIQWFSRLSTKKEDGNIEEMVARGFTLMAEDGYVQIYENPNYTGDGTFR